MRRARSDARGDDERAGRSRDARRAAEDELSRLDEWAFAVDELRGAVDRLGLAGERGEIDLDRPVEQAGVGGDSLTLVDDEHVARHELRGVDLARRPSRSTVARGGR
jgi:hypothetical protein